MDSEIVAAIMSDDKNSDWHWHWHKDQQQSYSKRAGSSPIHAVGACFQRYWLLGSAVLNTDARLDGFSAMAACCENCSSATVSCFVGNLVVIVIVWSACRVCSDVDCNHQMSICDGDAWESYNVPATHSRTIPGDRHGVYCWWCVDCSQLSRVVGRATIFAI